VGKFGNDREMTAVGAVLAALYGLVIGSFLNVVISRVPSGESVRSPRSRCPKCKGEITARDNIPLLSWILLRGRCRNCEESISIQYPLIELLTAALFAGFALTFGVGWSLFIVLALTTGLIPLSIIDLNLHLLPKRIFYPTLIAVTALLIAQTLTVHDPGNLVHGLIGAAIWSGLFLAIFLARPDALGFGDVRLVVLLGLAAAWFQIAALVLAFFLSNLLALAVALYLLTTGKASRRTPIPYGLFLSAGTVITLFLAPLLQHHFQGRL
jgi:leader peptidase (prepilin peptidase)/N-methyltransferase